MVRNNYGSLYVGVTRNITERIKNHNTKRGSKFTKGKEKFNIVFLEEYDNLSLARKREIQIKKWRRDKKDFLIKRFLKGLPTK
jgi:putative endonuclease